MEQTLGISKSTLLSSPSLSLPSSARQPAYKSQELPPPDTHVLISCRIYGLHTSREAFANSQSPQPLFPWHGAGFSGRRGIWRELAVDSGCLSGCLSSAGLWRAQCQCFHKTAAWSLNGMYREDKTSCSLISDKTQRIQKKLEREQQLWYNRSAVFRV